MRTLLDEEAFRREMSSICTLLLAVVVMLGL